MDNLLTDNTMLNQRVATIGIDQETSENSLDEFDQLLSEAENKISMLENEEILLRESLQSARNEIARLNGNLAIAEDRLSLTEEERGENFGALRRAGNPIGFHEGTTRRSPGQKHRTWLFRHKEKMILRETWKCPTTACVRKLSASLNAMILSIPPILPRRKNFPCSAPNLTA